MDSQYIAIICIGVLSAAGSIIGCVTKRKLLVAVSIIIAILNWIACLIICV